jgi:hypothetical protein
MRLARIARYCGEELGIQDFDTDWKEKNMKADNGCEIIKDDAKYAGSFEIQNDKEQFDRLVEQWRSETGMYSSITKKVSHPAYKRIIAFGERAVPWILVELRDRPTYWFAALQEIAKDAPVGAGQYGDFKAARDAWLAWGRQRGLID